MLEGKLIAEFSSFYEAVDKASVKFRSFEEDGAKVEKRLNSIADGFSGRKVVQEATIVTEAIQRIGGVSKLSTNEAASGLATLEKAMDKMLKTGQDIPLSMTKTAAELRNVARVTELADKSVSSITQNYQKFDGVLQSLGINIGPYVKGLEDISALAGGGSVKVFSFAGAAAAVATALAAWNLGKHIGEVSGLTAEISKGISVMMGWGNVAEQEALAAADAFDLMGKAEENIRRNAEAAKQHEQAVKEESDALKENWRITEGNKDAMANLARELEAAKEKRKQDAIETFKASQAQSIFGDETEQATQAIVKQNSALDAREESLRNIAEAAALASQKQNEFMNAPTLNNRENAPISSDIQPLRGFALDDVINKFKEAGDQNPEQALQRALAYLESREGRIAPKTNEQFFQQQRDAVLLAQLRLMLGGRTSFESGTGMSGSDMLVSPTKREIVTTAGRGAVGDSKVVNMTINVNGTGEQVAKQVGDILMDKLEATGYVARRR